MDIIVFRGGECQYFCKKNFNKQTPGLQSYTWKRIKDWKSIKLNHNQLKVCITNLISKFEWRALFEILTFNCLFHLLLKIECFCLIILISKSSSSELAISCWYSLEKFNLPTLTALHSGKSRIQKSKSESKYLFLCVAPDLNNSSKAPALLRVETM